MPENKMREADLLFDMFISATRGKPHDEVIYALSMTLAYQIMTKKGASFSQTLDEVSRLAGQEIVMTNSLPNQFYKRYLDSL